MSIAGSCCGKLANWLSNGGIPEAAEIDPSSAIANKKSSGPSE